MLGARRIVLALALLVGSLVIVVGSPQPAQALDHCVGQATMVTGSPGLVYPVVGPARTLPWTLATNFGMCASLLSLSMSGTLHGNCGMSVGAGVANTGAEFTWAELGGWMWITGDIVGTAFIEPDWFSGHSCITGASRFLVTMDVTLLAGGGSPPTSTSTTTSTTAPPVTLPPTPTTTTTIPPPDRPSDACTTPIHDSTTLGVSTKLATAQPTGATWVCVRAAGFGGRVEIHNPTTGSPPPPPSHDDQSQLCKTTTPNAAPGPHPYDEGNTAGVAHFFDVWSGPGEAWVCIQVSTTKLRVKVPTTTGTSPTPPQVIWRPDPGTPGG